MPLKLIKFPNLHIQVSVTWLGLQMGFLVSFTSDLIKKVHGSQSLQQNLAPSLVKSQRFAAWALIWSDGRFTSSAKHFTDWNPEIEGFKWHCDFGNEETLITTHPAGVNHFCRWISAQMKLLISKHPKKKNSKCKCCLKLSYSWYHNYDEHIGWIQSWAQITFFLSQWVDAPV